MSKRPGAGKVRRAPPPPRKKGAKRPDLVRRQEALMTTMRRFEGRKFKLGKADCVVMLRAHLIAMGHRKLPKLPAYRNAVGAMKALKSQGVKNVEELADKYLTRIPPAAMLPGDIALVPTEQGEDAWQAGTIVISVGRKWLSWPAGEDLPLCVMEPVGNPFLVAWRA